MNSYREPLHILFNLDLLDLLILDQLMESVSMDLSIQIISNSSGFFYDLQYTIDDDDDFSETSNDLKDMIDHIPHETAKKVSCCHICLENIQVNDEQFTLTCKHSYHRGCIQKWLREKMICPTCRTSQVNYFEQMYRNYQDIKKV